MTQPSLSAGFFIIYNQEGIMPAGTITLTNNSAVVKGSGTAFTTELKPGDFIVAVVGGVTYTLPVKAVDNSTQVTLIRVYDGPTQAGAAWSAVPRETLNAITAKLAAESSRALRGLNYDKDNWQRVFSGTGNITVKLPDGSTFTGPAWNNLAALLNNAVSKTGTETQGIKSDLSVDGVVTLKKKLSVADLGSFSGGLHASTKVGFLPPAQGAYIGWNRVSGTGAFELINHRGGGGGGFNLWNGTNDGLTKIFSVGPDGSTKHIGNISADKALNVKGDTKLNTLTVTGVTMINSTAYYDGAGSNSGGEVRSTAMIARPYGNSGMRSENYCVDVVGNRFEHRVVVAQDNNVKVFAYRVDGNAWAPGTWQNGSDRRIKTDIKKVENALDKIEKLNGYTFKKGRNDDAGVIAQELIEVLPQAVANGGDYTLDDGTVVKDCLGVAYGALSALFIESIKELSDKVRTQGEEIERLKRAMGS
jgi:hypothetical protein